MPIRSPIRRALNLRLRSPDVVALVGFSLFGLAVRVWAAASQSLWGDEMFTRLLMGRSLINMLKTISVHESTPGLFFMANWAVTRITGIGDVGLRSLSVISGVAVIPMVFVLGRWVGGRTAGLVAAGLCTVHPLLIWYSVDARSYSSLVLLTTVGWITFGRVVEQPSADRLVPWSITACFTLALHYFGAFVVAGQFLWLLVTQRAARKQILLCASLMAAVGAAEAPLWAAELRDKGLNPFAVIPLARRLSDAGGMTVVGVSAPTWPLALPGVIFATVALVLLFRGTGSEVTSRARHLLGGATLGLAVALLVGRDYLIGRNVIGAWPVLIVLCSAGIALAPRRIRLLLGIGLTTVTVAAASALLFDDRLQRPDWRRAASVVGEGRSDLAVVVVGGFYAGAMTAYLDSPVVGDVDAREVVAIGSVAPERRRGCYNGPMCSVTPAEPVERPLPGLRLVERRRTGLWRIAIYRAEAPVRVDNANVARFFTAPRPFAVPIIYAPRS
jgi:hypothetical protein